MKKRKMIPAAEWGRSLNPPVGSVRARALAATLGKTKRKIVVVGYRAILYVEEGATVKREPVGRPRKKI